MKRLDDFDLDTILADPPRCRHCHAIIPNSAPAESYLDHVLAKCPNCNLWTPFKVEPAA